MLRTPTNNSDIHQGEETTKETYINEKRLTKEIYKICHRTPVNKRDMYQGEETTKETYIDGKRHTSMKRDIYQWNETYERDIH